MLGYDSWRDVRNDLILFYVVFKLALLSYLLQDWWTFSCGGSSRVIGYVVTHFGWDSPITEFVRRLWGMGR